MKRGYPVDPVVLKIWKMAMEYCKSRSSRESGFINWLNAEDLICQLDDVNQLFTAGFTRDEQDVFWIGSMSLGQIKIELRSCKDNHKQPINGDDSVECLVNQNGELISDLLTPFYDKLWFLKQVNHLTQHLLTLLNTKGEEHVGY